MRRSAYHKSVTRLLDRTAAIARLASQIDAKGVDDCHEWTGSKNFGGYGQVCIEGTNWLAHRLIFELNSGPIPPYSQCEDGRYMVLHKCDNPACCNPRHLYLGNRKNNSDDMVSRKRGKDRSGQPVGRVWYEFRGEVLPLSEWSRRLGLSVDMLNRRFVSGWPEGEIASRPEMGRRRHVGIRDYRRFSGDQEAAEYIRSQGKAAR